MKRCGVYLRVSTREQADHGWSIDGQYNEIRAWVDRNREDIQVTRRFCDAGFSATTLERPGLMQLFDAIEKKAIDTLIIWKFDRLSRDNLDFPGLMYFFTKHEVEIISINEPSLDYATPYGEFIVGILGLVATLERRMIQARVVMAMRERAKAGLFHGGPTPLGYDYVEGRLVPNNEASTVRLMFELFLETDNINAVRRKLIKRGITTRSGTFFNSSYIREVLKRRRYVGWMWYDGIQWEDPSIRLVSDEVFNKANELLHYT